MKDSCIKNNVNFTLVGYNKVNADKFKDGDELLNINVPVIFVTSKADNCWSFQKE